MMLLVALSLWASLWATPAWAGEDSRLAESQAMVDAGQPEAARALLMEVVAHGSGKDAEAAQVLLEGLPTPSYVPANKARIIVWQGLSGAFVAGTLWEEHHPNGWDGFVAAYAVGGGAGLYGGWRLIQGGEPTPARTAALLVPQQLGMANTYILSANNALDDYYAIAGGVGMAAGLGVSALALRREVPEPVLIGARAGAAWGSLAGVGVLNSANVRWGWETQLVLLTGLNGGALAGAGLARRVDLTTAEIRAFNSGALVGAAAAYGTAWMTSEHIIWTTPVVVSSMGGGALLGGGAAMALVRRGRGGEVPEGQLTVVPTDGGARLVYGGQL